MRLRAIYRVCDVAPDASPLKSGSRLLPILIAFKVICVRGSINGVDKAESRPGSWAR